MKKTENCVAQIVKMFLKCEKGRSVEDICSEHGVHRETFLQLEEEIFRDGCHAAFRIKSFERKERTAKKDVCRASHG